MATTTTAKLVMVFTSATGDDVTFSYNHADTEMAASSVQALVQGLITNGSIFAVPPVAAKSAKIVTTTSEDVDLE